MLRRAQAPPPTSRTDDLQAQARRSGSLAGGAPPSNASPLDGTLSGRAPGAPASAVAPPLISAPRLRRVAVLERWRAEGMLALLGLALLKLIVQLAVAGRYGFHRDELYYLAAGRHPSLGYVDYPPVTAWMARLSTLVFGHSLVGLRVWPAMAGAVIVVLGGLIARELGGGRFAQILAALLVLCSPMFLGSNSMFQTVSFDELTWAVCLYLVARLLARGGPPRLWLAIGVAFGIGLETKYTILVLGMGFAVGLALTAQRRWLLTPWPWLAALIATALLACWLPARRAANLNPMEALRYE